MGGVGVFRFGVFMWLELASQEYEAWEVVRAWCADEAIQTAMRTLQVSYAHRVVAVPVRASACEVERFAVRCFLPRRVPLSL
jgi:hypothetical protein